MKLSFYDFLVEAPKRQRIRRPADQPSSKQRARRKKWNEAKSGRLIRKAAEILADKGYISGRLESAGGNLCIRGAVNYAWSGNARITDNYEYFDQENRKPSWRNVEVVQALTDFRLFLYRNGKIIDAQLGVEAFNDGNSSDEVTRWMHKFADEVDPKK